MHGFVRGWLFGAALAGVAWPGRLQAQEERLAARCVERTQSGSEEAERFCQLIAQAIEIAQPRMGLAFTGGNPVPGTASTLGMRLGTLPRVSVAGRFTGVAVEVPQILRRQSRNEIDYFLPSFNLDGSVGILSGFSPAPTVGGVGSLDLLGSLGILPLPNDDGFDDATALSWAIGARLGLLRESFTLPGVSVSGVLRRVPDVTFGDPQLDRTDAFFASDLTVLSARAAVSKRVLLLGATAGVGYDHYTSDLDIGFRTPDLLGFEEFRVRFEDFENDRFSAFLNLSWTLLILHAVGELGWQEGADRVRGVSFDADDGTFFGSLALRVSI